MLHYCDVKNIIRCKKLPKKMCFVPSAVSGIVLKKKKMDEKKRYNDRPTTTFFDPCKFEETIKKVSFLEENFETQRKFLDY